MASAKRIEFDAPEGFVLPEGKAINEDIECMAVVRMKADGRLCLVELNGERMPGYKEDDDEHQGKSYPQVAADEMDKAMPHSTTPGGY